MYWKIYILIAIIFWAVGQVLIRDGFKKASVYDTFFMGGVWGTLVYLPYVYLHRQEFQADFNVFLLTAFVTFGYLVYYKALSVGNFSINNTVISTFPLITLLFSQLFLQEPLTFVQWIGIAIISVGVILLSYFNQGGFLRNELRHSHLGWPIFASVYIGFGDFLMKIVEMDSSALPKLKNFTESLSGQTFFIFEYIGNFATDIINNSYSHASLFFFLGVSQLISGFIIKMFHDKFRFNFAIFSKKGTITGNFLLSAGTLFFYLALFSGWASLVVPVSASHVILAVILAGYFLHEKLSKTQYLIILFIVIGNILVNIN